MPSLSEVMNGQAQPEQPAPEPGASGLAQVMREPDPVVTGLKAANVAQQAPERAVRVLDLVGKTGLPTGFIDENLDDVELATRQKDFNAEAYRRNHPGLSAWMAKNPSHYAFAMKDRGFFENISHAVHTNTEGWANANAQDELARLSYHEFLGNTLTPAQQARKGALEKQMQDYARAGMGDSKLSYITRQVGYGLGQSFLNPTNMERTVKAGLAGASAGAVLSAAGAGVGAVPGALAGIATNNINQAFWMETGLAFNEFSAMKDVTGQPMDPTAARAAAAGVGGINALIEVAGDAAFIKLVPGAKKLLDAAGGGSAKAAVMAKVREALANPARRSIILNALKKVGGAASVEGITEAMQELVGAAGRETGQALSGQDFAEDSFQQDLAQAGQVGFDTFVGQFFGRGLLPGSMQAMEDHSKAKQAKRLEQVYTAMAEGAESEAFKSLPQAAQDAVKSITGGTRLEQAYMDPAAWDGYWQGKGVDAREVAAEVLGDGGQAYDDAVKAGTDLVIPMDRYARKLATTEHNEALFRELRFADENGNVDVSLREADERLAAAEREAQLGPAAEMPRELDGPAQVGQIVREMLTQTGENRERADKQAKLWESRYRARMERRGEQGVTAVDLLKRWPLRIQREGGPDLTFDVAALEAENEAERQAMEAERKAAEAEMESDALVAAGGVTPINDAIRGWLSVETVKANHLRGELQDINDLFGGEKNLDTAAMDLLATFPELAQRAGVTDMNSFLDALIRERQAREEYIYQNGEGAGRDRAAGERALKRLQAKVRRTRLNQSEKNVVESATGGGILELRTDVVPTLEQWQQAVERLKRLEKELRTDHLTGLRSELTYKEDEALGWPMVASLDVDGLGRMNDFFGHEAGNMLLKGAGAMLGKAEGNGEAVRFYRLHGDEMAARFKDAATAEQFMARLQQELEGVTLELDKDGRIWDYQGIGLSYGVGENDEAADATLYDQKRAREAAGIRQPKTDPPGAPKRAGERAAAGAEGSVQGGPGEGDAGGQGGEQTSAQLSEIQDALDAYNEGTDTADDLASKVEGVMDDIDGSAGEAIRDAVEKFREEQEYDRDLKGRGDMGSAEDEFVAAIEAALNPPAQPTPKLSAVERAVQQSLKLNQEGRGEQTPAPVWFSKLVQTIEAKLPAKASAEQVRGLTKDLSADEKKWLGLDEFLKNNPKVEKATLVEFLRANMPQIQEVVKGGDLGLKLVQNAEETDYAGKPMFDVVTEDGRVKYTGGQEDAQEYIEEERQLGDRKGSGTKFGEYQLPGGANYREVLFTLPPKADVDEPAQLAALRAAAKSADGLDAEEKWLLAYLEKKEKAGTLERSLDTRNAFKSSHWDEPNVLAHVRLNDRTDADGKRVLFVEEIQSDWHQKGRKEGYASEEGKKALEAATAEHAALDAEDQRLLDKRNALYSAMSDKTLKGNIADSVKENTGKYIHGVLERLESPTQMDGDGTIDGDPFFDKLKKNDPAAFERLKEFQQVSIEHEKAYALETAARVKRDSLSRSMSVPDAPFRKTWHEFAFKRILRMAAEGGYDRVAWTTSAPQAERYDLSKKVDQLLYDKNADGTYALSVISQHRGQMLGESIPADKLDDYVGKEVAQKIVNGDGKKEHVQGDREYMMSLSGLDLKVGGEGMNGFYDKILPEWVNKFAKKFGGRVGETRLAEKNVPSKGSPVSEAVARGESPVHSIDITPALKDAALGQGFSLFQDPRRGKDERGSINIDDAETLITLGRKADATTFLHESWHRWFFEMAQDVEYVTGLPERTPVQQKLVDDFNALLRNVGAKDWASMTREQQEQLAKYGEAYLMEGKAPSAELRGAMASFRAWMVHIYTTVKAMLQGKDPLNPEVQGILDRMLATDEEIAQAEAEVALAPLPGMEQDPAYAKALADAHEAAVTKLSTKALAELARERTAMWKEERDKLIAESIATHGQEPVYRALALLQHGTMPDGSPLPEGTPAFKLSKESIVQRFSSMRLPKARPYVYSVDGGVDVETAAELLGFSSADEMLTALDEARPLAAVAAEEADAEMKVRHGDMMLDGSMTDEARKAVHNDQMDRVHLLEWDYLAAQAKGAHKGLLRAVFKRPDPRMYKAQAEAMVARRAVKDIKPINYQRAQARAAKEKTDLALKGDFRGALAAKDREMLNAALYRAAVDAREQVDALVEYMRKFQKPSVRERLGKAGGDYLEQIDALARRYSFAPASLEDLARRASLREFMAKMEEQGTPVDIPEAVLNDAREVSYKEASFEELVGLRDTVKQIEHLAGLKNKLLKATRMRELDAALDEATASIEANSKGARPREVETRLPQDELLRSGAGFLASHRKMASLVREMDGFKDGGVLWELLVRPLNDAGTAEAVANEKATKALKAIFDVYGPEDVAKMYRKEFIPGAGTSLTKMGQLVVALNWGNEDNRTKLKDGYGWTDAQVQAILDRLDERDWKVVQAVWDHIDSYWPETEAMSKRVKGVAPEKVQAAPVQTKFGVFKGGYFPLKYDDRQEPRAYAHLAEEAAKRAMGAGTVRSTTKQGHRKARVEGVKMPVRLDFGVIFEHVAEVIHDQTHYETLIDLNKLLGDRRLQSTIIAHHGDQVYRQLTAAVNDVAAGNVPAQQSMERAINYLRVGTTISGLGWNLFTSLMQPLGLTQSMVRIGPKWVAKGLSRWLGDATRMENTAAFIEAKSDFMRLRGKTQQREINEVRNELRLRGKLSKVEDSYFWFIAKGQQLVDIPTWMGAYEKAMADGETDPDVRDMSAEAQEARAVALADQAVLDSQGGGQVKDLAQIQRGGPLLKLWTNFYSFFNTTYNLAVESGKRTNWKKPASVGRFAVDMMLLYVAPAMMGLALREALKGRGGDDEDLLDKALREQVAYIMGSLVLVREVAGAVQGFRGYEGPAGTRAFSEVGKLFKQVEQGEVDEALLRSLNSVAGILFHYPAGQVDRSVRGTAALLEGQAGPMAPLFGPPPQR